MSVGEVEVDDGVARVGGQFAGSIVLMLRSTGDGDGNSAWRVCSSRGTLSAVVYGTDREAAEKLVAINARERDALAARRDKGVLHIQRPPLPWHGRGDALSLCGRSSSRLTHERPGRNTEEWDRLCGVCRDRTEYSLPSWDRDPARTLEMWSSDRSKARQDRLKWQLLALGYLTAENLDRFRDLVDGERALNALL